MEQHSATLDREYVVGTWAPTMRLGPGRVGCESAYLGHLRMLRDQFSPHTRGLRVIGPAYSANEYSRVRGALTEVDEARERIFFEHTHQTDDSTWRFWTRRMPMLLWQSRTSLRNAAVLQSGLDDDIRRPVLTVLNLRAVQRGTPVVFILDIDFRRDAWMALQNGLFTLKQFVSTTLLCDSFRWAQLLTAPALYDLVLLKSAELAERYGQGRANVHDFYDTAHGPEQLVDATRLHEQLSRLRTGEPALRVVYFGRLVAYKGIDRAIEAVHLARELSGRDIRLHVIGSGPEEAALRALHATHATEEAVTFHGALPYGPALFSRLTGMDVSIAAPLMEDTPRSAFDSMAAGLPIVAFDTAYYRGLAREGAVALCREHTSRGLAERLVALDGDRAQLCALAERGVRFARDNAQQVWIERRKQWTEALLV